MRCACLGLSLLVLASTSAADIVVLGKLTGTHLNEVSGIAISPRDDNVVWAINDSGNEAALHAFSVGGQPLGTVRVRGARNHDWEDLAAFESDGSPYLLVADTGDNYGRRAISYLLILQEPQESADGIWPKHTAVYARVPFRYEDGPRDCEAVAIDAENRRILLVSKRDIPAAVYELPLSVRRGNHGVGRAKRIATITALPRPTVSEVLESPVLGAWRHQPTAVDIFGSRLALLTYQNLYLFQRSGAQTWSAALAADPVVIRLPQLSQTESLAIREDRVIIVAEGRNVPILSISMR